MEIFVLKNIIFDMDGIIIDSNPTHIQAERETFAKFDLNVPEEEWRSFKGRTHHDIFSTVVSKYGSPSHDVDAMLAHRTHRFMKMASEVKLIPGADVFIRAARRQYSKLAITTSSRRDVLDAILPRHDILDNFDLIITGDQINKGKPDPEPYLVTLAGLGAPASEALVIEDADNGVVSAKRAGCFVAALTTSCTEQELLDAGADIVCASYQELSKQLHLG